MRLVTWLAIVIVVIYGIYNGAMALRSHQTLSAVVDEVLERSEAVQADAVRELVIQRAADRGVPLDQTNVLVTEQDAAISVRVVWSWPVFEYQGEEVVKIPLSVERVVNRPPR